jgi:hypothetical protein
MLITRSQVDDGLLGLITVLSQHPEAWSSRTCHAPSVMAGHCCMLAPGFADATFFSTPACGEPVVLSAPEKPEPLFKWDMTC